MQAPLLVNWQYWEPAEMLHKVETGKVVAMVLAPP